jgi:hypothetical protein
MSASSVVVDCWRILVVPRPFGQPVRASHGPGRRQGDDRGAVRRAADPSQHLYGVPRRGRQVAIGEVTVTRDQHIGLQD